VLNYQSKECELRIDNYTFTSLFDGKLYDKPAEKAKDPWETSASANPSKAGAGWDQIRSMQGRDDRLDQIPDGYGDGYPADYKHSSSDEDEKPVKKVAKEDFFNKDAST
jgi:hypothetical protein